MIDELLSEILNPIGGFMQLHNLGINLVLLTTYQRLFHDEGNEEDTDVFMFTPTPSNVFHSGVYAAGMGTVDSVCELQPSVNFDRANSQFNVMYDYDKFANSSACSNAVDPYHMGYDHAWSGEYFDIATGDLLNFLSVISSVTLIN